MKLMIASDIHGSAVWCGRLLEAWRREAPARLILLGDLLYHGPRNDLPEGYAPKAVIPMLDEIAPHLLCVRGNCEAEVDQMVLSFPVMADYAALLVDGWSVDGRLLGGNGRWGRRGSDSDYTDPTGLLLLADQVAQHPLGGGGGGMRTHQMARVIRAPVTLTHGSS